MPQDKDLAAEMDVGTVLVLCPQTLLTLGGKPTGPSERWVVDHHFFLVLEADPKRCRLLPLYSNDGTGRAQIPIQGRSGHVKWTTGVWHYHPVQTWTASRQTIVRAADKAGDLSTKGNRNLLESQYVPQIP